ncbi:LON peptidase substrate-binding domain-containing protein [Microbacterium sp. SORGH_AS_0888]|uniref:LON peptidase substrate-binding domain-containing protein n=1 Tax=Microbacterium sp. SORGH_AS_0888 TaxID=3041791 RepID=UPI002788A164|nr:LON peptidase substrate-binding domain-containing protein [Microbacterium sp. SORGH_AS_0888]MDQ1128840.1 Lon protease-like protein [Microbacterium sp. SORGH_AS_0888]
MGPVAMFPLSTVLLPAMPLPLRIFEERYRILLGRLLEEEEPEFGVVLIARGAEAGGGEVRHDIGTLARIVRVTAGESDIGLLTTGGRRIRVTEWLADDPYPRAMVETLPDLEFKDELGPLLREVDGTVRRVLARAAEYADTRWDAGIELSDEPVAAAWQLAGIAPLGSVDRLELLHATTLGELLRRTLDLVIAAEPALTAPPAPDEVDAALEDLLRDESPPGDA